MNIEYNGRQDFERPRKLTDLGNQEQFQDNVIPNSMGQTDQRSASTDTLFNDLAKVYVKGKVLKAALSKMDPAQFIPIEEFADSTRAAACRLNREDSEDGKIISFSLYQKCIEIILDKKWELRGTVINMRVPASTSQSSTELSEKLSNSKTAGGLLKEFINQNGIVSTILGMLTISPFQTVIFQALGVEQGAKGIQIAQIPAGIVLFLEIGIKAERIIKIMKGANLPNPLVEQQIATLSTSPSARAAALESIGIDYDQFKKSQEFQDSEDIVKYVSEYYQRYGGLDRPNGHLTIDHWIAYGQVAQNQQSIRGCLNNAPLFSPKFNQIKQDAAPTEEPENIFSSGSKKTSNIFVQLASATRALKESSNDVYDDITSAFVYQLTDRDLCCVVQIFGTIGNPDILYTIASLMRILATNLSGEILRLQNIVSGFLANLAQDALFEIIGNINKFYYKIINKITKLFTVDINGLEACSGMLTIGWGILQSMQVIFSEVQALLKEISSIIGDFGLGKNGVWEVSADRRFLLGTARILEVLAARIDLANTCDVKKKSRTSDPNSGTFDGKFDQAIFSILESPAPTLSFSDKDISRHFSELKPKTSSRLKYNYGMSSEQNNEANFGNCYDPDQKNKIEDLIKNITTSIQESFNG